MALKIDFTGYADDPGEWRPLPHRPEVVFRRQDVTPEQAQEWLDGQAANRNFKKQKIERYVRSIREGDWAFTGDALRFDVDGRMIDGQNRCAAIVKAGVTVAGLLVIEGLPTDTQDYLDQNAVRSGADTLAIHGFTDSLTLAATIAVHRSWALGAITTSGSKVFEAYRPSNSEMRRFADENPKLVEAAKLAKFWYHQRSLRFPKGAMAAAWFILSEVDYAAAEDFFDRLANSRTEGHGDPINQLLNMCREYMSTQSRTMPAGEVIYLYVKTWNAWRTKQKVTQNFRTIRKKGDGTEKTVYFDIPTPV